MTWTTSGRFCLALVPFAAALIILGGLTMGVFHALGFGPLLGWAWGSLTAASAWWAKTLIARPRSAGSQRSQRSCDDSQEGSVMSSARGEGLETERRGVSMCPGTAPTTYNLVWLNAQHLSKATGLRVEERTAPCVVAFPTATTLTIQDTVHPIILLHPIKLTLPGRAALLEAVAHAGHLHLRPWCTRRQKCAHCPRFVNPSKNRDLDRTSTIFSCAMHGMTGGPQQKS